MANKNNDSGFFEVYYNCPQCNNYMEIKTINSTLWNIIPKINYEKEIINE